jgi:hypothetical protein
MQVSRLEEAFAMQLRAYKIPFSREVRFAPPRKFRFDFLVGKLAIEVMGGVYSQGAHSRGKGQERDFEKNYLALCGGYRILYVSGDQVRSGEAIEWVKSLI